MNAGGEAIVLVRGKRQTLLFILEGLHCQHRAEDFFPHRRIVRAYALDQRRLEERAARTAVNEATAAAQFRAVAARALHDVEDARRLHRRNNRRQRGGIIPGRTGQQPGEARHDALDQRLGDAALHNQPRAGHAYLSCIAGDGAGNDARKPVKIRCIIEYKLRAFAAQLQRHRLRPLQRASRHDRGARARRSREGHFRDQRVARQRIARRCPVTLHHVEQAGRQAGFDGQLSQAHRGERRQFGGLQHHGVARGKRGTNLPGHHHQREIPGRDRAHHAIRLGYHHAKVIVARSRHLAAQLVGILGEEPQSLRRERYIPCGSIAHRPGRAHGFERREATHVRFDQVRPSAQHAGPLARRAARPVAGTPGLPRVPYGCIDRRGVGQRKLGMHLAIGGTPHGNTAGIRHELSTNEMAGGYGDSVGVKDLHGMTGASVAPKVC
ncbi:hypothetical protein CBM2629_U20030 [Cupriavidus taiwanensis]|nr:hypothetical protein CBM2629_U20030 [Cupriavidus taiwanensis]